MIHELKPYPAYKDSGMPWLGDVPLGWSIGRAKNSFRLRTQKSGERHGLELLSVYTHIGVRPRKDLEERGNKATTTDDYWIVKRGDIVSNKLLAWMGAIGVSHYDGVTSPAYDILRPIQPLDPDFYHYLFRTSRYLQQFKLRSRGIMEMRLRLYFDQMGQVPIVIPPVSEQSVIVRFLDHADRRIRRCIRAKQNLIKLLEEQKQAIIHRAVTRGLDPNVRLKSSGVEWLGDVPEHWRVRSFTRCAIERADYRGATPTKTDSGVFLVTARNVRKGRIDYAVSKEFVAAAEYATIMRRGLPRIGDLLLTMEAPLGNAALVDREDVAFAQRVVRFRFDPTSLAPEFVLHSVLGAYFQNQLLRRGTGSTALGIKASKLPQLQLLCPPVAEQEAILKHIRDQYSPIDEAAERARREVLLLHEYRTRLIADVVTGKLDVREAAAKLPAEIEESELPLAAIGLDEEPDVDLLDADAEAEE